MKTLMLIKVLLAAAVLSARGGGTNIIYDTLSQTAGITGGSWIVNHWYWPALAFVPDTNYNVTSVQVYMCACPFPSISFSVELRGDADGKPGSILDSVPMVFPTTERILVSALFPGTPVSGGTRYWLTLTSYDEYGGGWWNSAYWSPSAPSVFRESNNQGSSWWGYTSAEPLPTARISGSVIQPIGTPSLSIVSSNGIVALSWPLWSIGWELQSTTNLYAPITWTNIPSPYASDATDFLFFEPLPIGARFYRLKNTLAP